MWQSTIDIKKSSDFFVNLNEFQSSILGSKENFILKFEKIIKNIFFLIIYFLLQGFYYNNFQDCLLRIPLDFDYLLAL